MYHKLTEKVLGEEIDYYCVSSLHIIYACYRKTNELYLHPNLHNLPDDLHNAYVVTVVEDFIPKTDPDFLYKENCFTW